MIKQVLFFNMHFPDFLNTERSRKDNHARILDLILISDLSIVLIAAEELFFSALIVLF